MESVARPGKLMGLTSVLAFLVVRWIALTRRASSYLPDLDLEGAKAVLQAQLDYALHFSGCRTIERCSGGRTSLSMVRSG